MPVETEYAIQPFENEVEAHAAARLGVMLVEPIGPASEAIVHRQFPPCSTQVIASGSRSSKSGGYS